MPIYDFKCPACGHKFEILLPIDKRDEAICENCGAQVKRVYSGKCAFGAKAGGGCSAGSCAGCAGCNH
jgi:putative FmdB family regulatory protein